MSPDARLLVEEYLVILLILAATAALGLWVYQRYRGHSSSHRSTGEPRGSESHFSRATSVVGSTQILTAWRGVRNFIAKLREASAQRQRAAAESRYATLRMQLRNVHLMSGRQFEQYIAVVLKDRGCGVRMLGGAGDQGVDLIVSAGDQRIAVQCKNHRKAVGNRPIQEVLPERGFTVVLRPGWWHPRGTQRERLP